MNSRTLFIRTLTCVLAVGGSAACGMDASDGSPQSGAGAGLDNDTQQELESSNATLAKKCGPSAPPDGAVQWQHDFGLTNSLAPSSVSLDREGNVFHASVPTGVSKLDAAGASVWQVPVGSLVAAAPNGHSFVASLPSGTTGAKVTKLDADGATVWSVDIGSAAPQSIAVTPHQGVLVSGNNLGTIRLNARGRVQWTKPFGGYVASTAEGGALVTGSFEGTVDFGAGPVVSNQIDAFIVKLDAAGGHLWSHILTDATLPINRPGGSGGVVTQPSPQIGKRIAEAPNGDVVVTGFAYDSIKLFGQDVATPDPPDVGLLPLVYVAKLTGSGEVLWKTFDYGFRDARGITADVHGNVIVSGGLVGHAPPFVRTWIEKLDTTGARVWKHEELGAFGYGYADALTTDRCGNIFVALESSLQNGNTGIIHARVAKLRP